MCRSHVRCRTGGGDRRARYGRRVPWPTLRTERLVLRPLTLEDLNDLAPLHAQESFWRYPFGRGQSRQDTEDFLEDNIRRYSDPGIAVSAVVIAETGQLAGWAGLSIPTFLPEILPAVEVGWRLGEQYRGHGYATEAGAAWVAYGFEHLGLDRIVSIFQPDNVASGAVMRRLGFSFERETKHPKLGVVVHVFALTRDQWRALGAGRGRRVEPS
jgi:RimJ/RimL family protein N-acetyltransferase